MKELFIIAILVNIITYRLSSIPIYNCYAKITNSKNYNGLVSFLYLFDNFKELY